MSIVSVCGSATTKVTNIKPGDETPNAVDIRLAKVFKILPNMFEIDEANNKKHRGVEELFPDENGFWTLEPGSYEVIADNTVCVGPDEAGYVIGRSSLNRNDIYVRSCLYDSGYNGVMCAVMTIGTGPVRIQKGTRFAQYVSWKAESLKMYKGSYGFGTEDDAKYGVSK